MDSDAKDGSVAHISDSLLGFLHSVAGRQLPIVIGYAGSPQHTQSLFSITFDAFASRLEFCIQSLKLFGSHHRRHEPLQLPGNQAQTGTLLMRTCGPISRRIDYQLYHRL